MIKDKNVLVTGGTGFLGSHISKELIRRDAKSIVIPTTGIRQHTSLKKVLPNLDSRISVVEGDIRSFDFMQSLFMEYDFDVVFHLAAVSEVGKSQNNAKFALDVNVAGTINILEAARLYGRVQAIAVSSSDKAYGDAPLPYRESQPVVGSGVYEVSKACTDLIARMYAKNFNLPVAVTRCANLYGYGDMNTSRLIPNTIERVRQGKAPIIWEGSAKAIREFLHVSDAVAAYMSIVDNISISSGKVYNVGSDETMSVEQVIQTILEMSGTSIQPEYRSKDFPEIQNQHLDTSKIREELGWKAKMRLKDGVSELISAHSFRSLHRSDFRERELSERQPA